MTNRERAETVKWLSIIVGAICIASILFAPLGILIIRRGLRHARRLRETADEMVELSMQEWGLVQSWDDMPGEDR